MLESSYAPTPDPKLSEGSTLCYQEEHSLSRTHARNLVNIITLLTMFNVLHNLRFGELCMDSMSRQYVFSGYCI